MEPLYDHISNHRIIIACFNLFLFLLVLLLIQHLFFVAPDYRGYFRSLFSFFGAISLMSLLMYALLRCYAAYYNRHNQKLVDVLIEPDTVCLLV